MEALIKADNKAQKILEQFSFDNHFQYKDIFPDLNYNELFKDITPELIEEKLLTK